MIIGGGLRIVVAVGAVVGLLLGPAMPATATWSIVAVDPDSGRVGAAMASCIQAGVLGEPDQVLIPIVLVPGSAAAVTQGSIDPDAPAGLRQLLIDGAGPDEAVAALLEVDDQPTARQFGVVTVADAGARTGADAGLDRADAARPAAGGLPSRSVQGVSLADEAVVADSLAAFDRAVTEGATLEEALAAGLAAGSAAGGDRRCPEQTALFAHLAVADPDDDPRRPSLLLTVTVDEGDGQNPVTLLSGSLAEGRRGWVDAGLENPVGVPRIAVLAVGAILAIAAFLTIRAGLGSPSARR